MRTRTLEKYLHISIIITLVTITIPVIAELYGTSSNFVYILPFFVTSILTIIIFVLFSKCALDDIIEKYEERQVGGSNS